MEFQTMNAGAIKSDRLGSVRGYLVRFGNAGNTDLEGDYFTKSTDFGFPIAPGQRVPLNVYYHHGMDPVIGRKSIGTGFVKLTDEGLWYEAQLDMADEYAEMVAKLCRNGKMGYSSGAAGHLVERKSVGGATEITRWPIAEASITPTPAEWRNNVKSLKDMVGDMEEEDDMEPVAPPMAGEDAATFAADIYAGAPMALLYEGLEALYERLCAGLMAVADMDGEPAPFVNALLDEFNGRARSLIAGVDQKSLRRVPADTLRTVERRLRDAIGLSRSGAKRLAPTVWSNLRDADRTAGLEQPDDTVETKATTDTDERAALLERIVLLEQLNDY